MKGRRTDGVHSGGRPSTISSKPVAYFYDLLKDYDTMTIAELCKKYGYSRPTMCKHLKHAKEITGKEGATKDEE